MLFLQTAINYNKKTVYIKSYLSLQGLLDLVRILSNIVRSDLTSMASRIKLAAVG